MKKNELSVLNNFMWANKKMVAHHLNYIINFEKDSSNNKY